VSCSSCIIRVSGEAFQRDDGSGLVRGCERG
jgi:hypothetical protein